MRIMGLEVGLCKVTESLEMFAKSFPNDALLEQSVVSTFLGAEENVEGLLTRLAETEDRFVFRIVLYVCHLCVRDLKRGPVVCHSWLWRHCSDARHAPLLPYLLCFKEVALGREGDRENALELGRAGGSHAPSQSRTANFRITMSSPHEWWNGGEESGFGVRVRLFLTRTGNGVPLSNGAFFVFLCLFPRRYHSFFVVVES